MSQLAAPADPQGPPIVGATAVGQPGIGVLVRLKLRLVRNSLRSGGSAAIGFVFGAIAACCCIPVGIAVLLALRFSAAQNAVAPQGVIVLYARNMATAAALSEHGFDVVNADELLLGQTDVNVDTPKRTCILTPSHEMSRARGGPHCLTHPLFRD